MGQSFKDISNFIAAIFLDAILESIIIIENQHWYWL